MKVRIDVMLKNGVLDPQGKAVEHALGVLGFEGFGSVRIGKCVLVEMDETDPAKAMQAAGQMAEKLLANPVIEDFKVSVL